MEWSTAGIPNARHFDVEDEDVNENVDGTVDENMEGTINENIEIPFENVLAGPTVKRRGITTQSHFKAMQNLQKKAKELQREAKENLSK